MEKLLNEFVVNRPIETAWAVLTDVERIAPCLPGAQLQEIAGDVYRGVVKIKLGPISTAFKGQAQFAERDDAGHRAVLKAEGRDTGGKGNANALITAELDAISADVTRCKVITELHITGKVAQFGRGLMAEVSEKLMNQFADNLNTMLANETVVPAAVALTAGTAPAAKPAKVAKAAKTPKAATPEPTEPTAPPTAPPAADTPTVRTVHGPAAEPIELGNVAGGAILKRLLPVLGGLLIPLLLLRRSRK